MPGKSGYRGSLDGAPLTGKRSFVFPALSVFYQALSGSLQRPAKGKSSQEE